MNGSIRLTLIIMLLVVMLVFGIVVGRQVFFGGEQEPAAAPELTELNTYVYDQGRPLPDFELLNEKGETVTRENLKGRWTFAFIGYTNCPDICPAAMANLRRTESLLPEDLPQPDYLLITADPDYDTPDQLRDYVGFFGDNFHGLTGDMDTLREVAKSLNAVFVHRQVEGELMVDHSGHFALLNPEGEMIAVLQPPHDPEALAEAFERIYHWARANHPRAS